MGHRTKGAERCSRCRMHDERCICAYIPEFETRSRLVLVMHCREIRKTTATAPLALQVLKNSESHLQGLPRRRLDLTHLHEEGRRVLVLFPSEEARPLSRELLDEDPRPVTLVVPDGNWRQATRVPKRVPGLLEAEKVTLPPGAPTAWGVRRETRDEGLATYEAIARAFGVLESQEIQAAMETLFARMVETTMAARGYDKEGNPQ